MSDESYRIAELESRCAAWQRENAILRAECSRLNRDLDRGVYELASAVAAEREACASLCEERPGDAGENWSGCRRVTDALAKLIRARSVDGKRMMVFVVPLPSGVQKIFATRAAAEAWVVERALLCSVEEREVEE